MYVVYNQTLMEEIQNANFVSIQAYEMTGILCRSQFVLLLWYVEHNDLVYYLLCYLEFKENNHSVRIMLQYSKKSKDKNILMLWLFWVSTRM
jgi:hypothetical protein